MRKNYDSLLETSSLPLAGAIICSGISLDSVLKGQDGKATFVFNRSNNPNLEQITRDFWQKTLMIEPNSFWEAIRFLKSRIYGE